MHRVLGALAAVLVMVVGISVPPPVHAADTGTPAPQTARIVSDDPASFTPHVMDGEVLTMVQVGNQVLVGGRFTRVRNNGSGTDLARRNLFAFNATTGQVSTAFAPNPNAPVEKVQAAADGTSAYVGGSFTSVTSGGSTVSVSRLYRVDVTTGARIAGFASGSINGEVRDISVTGNRLWIAGKFTSVQGVAQRYLATLNASTGLRDPYFSAAVSGSHVANTATNVLQLATNPAGDRLIAVGNFDRINGVERDQFAVFDIGGPSYALANYYTRQFESTCNAKFYTYMSDVEFSPDGSFFVVSTTGAYGGYSSSMAGTSGCDVVARFEASAAGTNVRPTWTAYTGGDTTWTVEVTDDVVYAGGHQRWQNNPARGDAFDEGAVSRPGIAALSAHNGLPYSWNPTRTLGVGVKDMIATPAGLFVGSDTDSFGGETHRKVAFLPLATGEALPARVPHALPGDVFRVASGGSQLQRRGFDGTTATPPSDAPNGTGWGSAVGAFMVNGLLYTAYANGSLTRRSFDGETYGSAVPVQAADLLEYQDDWHNGDVPTITSLFYDRGAIFFTKSGSNQLFRRWFEPESDVVGQQRFAADAVSGISYTGMRGAFVASGRLYYATAAGTLNVADWNGTGPVAGSSSPISGAGSGWASRVLFLYQGSDLPPPQNQAPTASFTLSCTLLTCSFDASASADPDGSVTDYAWEFGDGTTSHTTSSTTSHTYADPGQRTVRLSVTDDDGLSGTTTRVADPSDQANPLAHVGSASTTGNRMNHSVSIPATVQPGDLLLVFFVANSATPSYTDPPGWTVRESASGGGVLARAYARIATAADPGRTVTVTSSGYAKDVMSVAAYRGVAADAALSDTAVTLQTTDTAGHVTPTVSAPDGTHWLVSYWADKSSTTSAWALPAGVTQRSTASGSPSGHISAVLGDSAGPVGAGSQGGLSATANSVGSTAVMFSVLLRPGG